MNALLTSKIPQTLLLSIGLAAPAFGQGLTQFENGQVAEANAVNANFNSLKTSVTTAQATADGAEATAQGAQTNASAAQIKATAAQNAVTDLMNQIKPITSAITVLSNGNVGIGKSSPTAMFHLGGDFRIDSKRRLRFGEDLENTDPMFLRRTDNGPNASNLWMIVGDDPNSGQDVFRIGTSTGTGGTPYTSRFVFYMSGTCLKPGGGSWNSLSDRREKRDIEPLDSSLSKLLELRGVSFYYKDPDSSGAAPGLRRGFVAQEVETVFPEWVQEESLEPGKEPRKILSICGFEALAVESLRELDAKNQQLRADNAALLERLSALEATVAQLKPLLATNK